MCQGDWSITELEIVVIYDLTIHKVIKSSDVVWAGQALVSGKYKFAYYFRLIT
jgi:hypothetical protein